MGIFVSVLLCFLLLWCLCMSEETMQNVKITFFMHQINIIFILFTSSSQHSFILIRPFSLREVSNFSKAVGCTTKEAQPLGKHVAAFRFMCLKTQTADEV